MLETLARGEPLADEVAVRAAMHLARDHGRSELRAAIADVAQPGKRDDLRGLAAAALWDLGEQDVARRTAEELCASRVLSTQVWGALITAAGAGKVEGGLLLSEPTFRRVQWGWVE